MNFYKILVCVVIVTLLIIINIQLNVFRRIFRSKPKSRVIACLRQNSPTGQTIPKRIHQIWNDDIVPAEFANNVKGLVRDNPPPEWEYFFWTKESGLKFLQDKYPALYKRVTSGIEDVMRADIIRLVAIHHYGGVYFDLDTVSVKPLDNFVETHNCSLVFEPGEHFLMQHTDFLLTNSALLCARNHSFYETFIAAINALPSTCKHAFNCTGPLMLSNFYQKLNQIGGDTTCLPKIESSEIFQDVYDSPMQTGHVTRICKDYSKLRPYEVKICDNWKQRGKEKRSLSPLALTYHTWYHVYGRNMTVLKENNIKHLVPHVKIYGRNVFT